MRSTGRTIVGLLLALLLAGTSVRADSYTWTGTTSNNWNVSTNWSPAGYPSLAGDLADFSSKNFGTATNLSLNAQAITIGGLTFGDATSPFYALTIPSGGSFIFDNGASDFTLNNSYSASNTVDVITPGITLNSNLVVNTDKTLPGGLRLSGIVSGTGKSITKNGTGKLFLNNANTYTGGTTLNTGWLVLENNAGAGTGTLTLSGGTLDVNGARTITNPQVWAGDFTYNGTNTLGCSTGTVTLSTSPTVTVNASTLTISSIIGESGGACGLTKEGAGTLTLSGANTFTGVSRLNAGTLALNNARALGTGSLTINGGTLTASTNTTLTGVNPMTWAGDFTYSSQYNDLNMGTGAVTLTGNRTVGSNSHTLTIGGAIGDDGHGYSLTKVGAATLTLAGANTYTGGSTVNAGVLALTGDNTSASSFNTTINNGGTLVLNSAKALGNGSLTINGGSLNATISTTLSTTNAMTWAGDFTFPGSSSLTTGSGTVTLTGNRTVTCNGSSTLTVNGNIGDDGSDSGYSLTKAGTGALALGGANTFRGGLVINAGTLTANSAGGLGAGPITVNSGTTLRLNYNGTYACGAVTATSATVQPTYGYGTLKNLTLTLQDGILLYNGGNANSTFDNSCTMNISGTVVVKRPGGYYNGPFQFGASITGTGKAVLNDVGGPSNDRVEFAATQQWSGGTDIKGVVNMLGSQTWGSSTGGILPAGTVTVYPVVKAASAPSALLNLLNSTAGSNGGLNPNTDLVLSSNAGVYGTVYLGTGVTNVVVHSLTVDGVVKPAGFYKAADLPNFLVTANTAYTIRVMTPDSGPNAIADLAGTSPDWMMITLTWTAPADNIDPIASVYDLRYSTAEITEENFSAATPITAPTPASPGQQETATVSGLQGNTTYYFAIKSADSGMNWSAISNVAAVTTIATDSVPPAAVNDLAVVDIEPNRVTLSWTATGDDGVTGNASAYDVRYSTNPISSDEDFAAATKVTSSLPTPKAPGGTDTVTISGLSASTQYYFAVKVGDEVPNWSAVSNVVPGTTLEADPYPPLAVSNLTIRGIGIHDVTLAWTAPADQGSAGTNAYDIRYSTNPISSDDDFDAATPATDTPVPAAPGTAEMFAVPGLSPSTTYYFALKTLDAAEPANISPMSNAVSGTTLPPVVPVTVHNPWLVNDRVADTHNLSTMAACYVNAYTPTGVVSPANDEAKAINIYNNQKRRLYHWGNEPPSVGGNSISDPTYNQNVFGWALCGRHADQGCTIANAAGLGTQKISVPGDWQMQFGYGGQFHLFHSMITFYVYTRDNPPHIASAAEIQADNSLVLNAVAEGRACPGAFLCGDTATWEADAVNHYGDGGNGVVATRWTGNMDLRIGQTFKRTCESWANEHPTTSGDPPFHHEASRDYKDWVNFPYWEPYRVDMVYYGSGSPRATYRRWANGTDTLAPDFRSAGYQAMLDPSSHDIATHNGDGITPDLHAAAVGTQGEAVFKVNVPFYITDASFSGDFVRTNTGDICNVLVSTNGTAWTNVYTPGLGTTHVTGQSLRTNVFGLWATYWIKIQIKSTTAPTNTGVSNFVLTTIFEHNKGAVPYLDAGVNNITLTFDNAAELAASGNVIHITYKWKEFDGNDWTIDKQFDTFATTSPYTFTITTGGASKPWKQAGSSYDVTPPDGTYPAVPRTEYIALEITQPDTIAPAPISGLVAGTTTKNSAALNWIATGDNTIYGKASRYDIRYSISPIATMDDFNAATAAVGVPMPQTAGSPETFTVSGLAPTTTYYFAVVAYDKGNNCSGLSNVVTATTLADTPPAAVMDLAAPSAGQLRNSIQLTWTASGDDGKVGTAARYDLRYSTGTISDMDSFNAATPVTGLPAPKAAGSAESFTVSGLTVATSYNFALVVYDASNMPSGLSNVVVASTAADVPPAAVTDLAAANFTKSSIQLTWTATGEDGSVGTASSYDLRYSTSPLAGMNDFNAATAVAGLPAPKAAGLAETFTVDGLTVGTTYYFAIVVYDAANQPSGLSNVVKTGTGKIGDVDGDGQVNLADLKLMIAAWNSEGGGAYANWNPNADLDGDNYVNLADLKILIAHWNS